MKPRMFADALAREASKPLYSDAIRAQTAELVDLIAERHDAAELLEIATQRRYGLRDTVALFRRPRLVAVKR